MIPLVGYWIHPPELKSGDEVPQWAGLDASNNNEAIREFDITYLAPSRNCLIKPR